ncbi:MAG: NTP transferase domain-containing protein, partial [Thiohalorhabdaceae bacterium]
MVRAAARSLLAGGLDRCLTVVRPEDDDVARSLEALGLEVWHCAASYRGMGASLASGVAAAENAQGWVIALGDMPWIDPGTTAAVADALRDGPLRLRDDVLLE